MFNQTLNSCLAGLLLKTKYCLIILLLSITVKGQQDEDWKTRTYSGGIFYSYLDYSDLNKVVTNSGYPELNFSPVGITYFASSYKKNIDLLFSSGFKSEAKTEGNFRLYTAEYHFDFSIGYRWIYQKSISLTPFAGIRPQSNGYWINTGENASNLSGFLSDPSNGYIFFSFRTSLLIGTQIGFLKNRENQDLINLRFDFSLWSPYTEYSTPGTTFNEGRLIKNGIFIYVGINPGF